MWRLTDRRLLEFLLKDILKKAIEKNDLISRIHKKSQKKAQGINQWIHKDKRTKYQYKLNLSQTTHGKIGTLNKTLHIYLLSLIKITPLLRCEKIDMFVTHPNPSKPPTQPIPRRTWNGWNGHQTLWPFSWYLHQEGHLDARIEWLIPYPPLRRVILSSLQNNFCLRRGIVSLYIDLPNRKEGIPIWSNAPGSSIV